MIRNDIFLASRSLEDKKDLDTSSEQIEEQFTLSAQKEPAKSGAGLILAEEIGTGHVSWNSRTYRGMIILLVPN